MTRRGQAKVDKVAASIEFAAAGDGWATRRGLGYHDGESAWPPERGRGVDLRNDGAWVECRCIADGATVVVAFNLLPLPRRTRLNRWEHDRAVDGVSVTANTAYDGRCFTRRGIDCESCALVPEKAADSAAHLYGTLEGLLAGERARCAAAVARARTLVPVPGLPYNVPPDWFAKSAAALLARKPVQLTPHGMGTGHTIRVMRRGTERWGKRADAQLEAKLGVGPLVVETFDYD